MNGRILRINSNRVRQHRAVEEMRGRGYGSGYRCSIFKIKTGNLAVRVEINPAVVFLPFNIIKVFTRRVGDLMNLITSIRVRCPKDTVRSICQIELLFRDIKRSLNRCCGRCFGRMIRDRNDTVCQRRGQLFCQIRARKHIDRQGDRIRCPGSSIRRKIKPDRVMPLTE